MLSIFIIPAGLTYTLGRMTGSPGHGWAVLAAMFVLFAAGFTTVYWAESQPHPLIHGAAQTGTPTAPGGNMEGKEVRNGIAESALFATITTDASCGAVNGMHDSFTPLGGMVVLTNIMLGEVIFGGVGSGLYGMLIFVVLAVFIAGLMVGRTPEYLGKKIESYDVKMTMLYVLIFPLIILTLTAIFVLSPTIGLSSLNNQGPHGLTEILYAYTSGAGNNGSAFAGLNANTWWYNVALGWDMLLGRLFMMIPVLALAGNLAQKKSVPPSPGTFPVKRRLVHRSVDRRNSDSWRAHVLPGTEPGPHSGAPGAQGRTAFLNRIRANTKRTDMASKTSLWNTEIMATALLDSVRKLDPRGMVKNPVMFVVEVGSVLTTALLIDNMVHHRPGFGFNLQITLWLWFTVLFANFAEAMAEGRGKAQADTLRKAKGETIAQEIQG